MLLLHLSSQYLVILFNLGQITRPWNPPTVHLPLGLSFAGWNLSAVLRVRYSILIHRSCGKKSTQHRYLGLLDEQGSKEFVSWLFTLSIGMKEPQCRIGRIIFWGKSFHNPRDWILALKGTNFQIRTANRIFRFIREETACFIHTKHFHQKSYYSDSFKCSFSKLNFLRRTPFTVIHMIFRLGDITLAQRIPHIT